MLSRTARPKVSGPPEASWASSKMMVIDCTVLFASVIGGNAAASPAPSQRSLIQPGLAPMTVAGGELQPTERVAQSRVPAAKRGAPAPQREPAVLTGGACCRI